MSKPYPRTSVPGLTPPDFHPASRPDRGLSININDPARDHPWGARSVIASGPRAPNGSKAVASHLSSHRISRTRHVHRSRINQVKDGAGPGVKLVSQVQVGQASILRAIDLGMGELGIQEVRAGPRSTIWAGHTIVDHGDPATPLSRGGRYDRAHEVPSSGRVQRNEDPEAPVPALVQPREVHTTAGP